MRGNPMKTLYIECNMGAAGDMLTAALLELTEDRDAVLAKLNDLGIPGVVFSTEACSKCGTVGTHVRVTVNGEEEESLDVADHDHDHGHHHDHEHHHHHEHTHSHEHSHDGHTHTHEHTHHHDHHDHDHEHEHAHEHGHHAHHGMAEISEIISGLNVSEKVKRDAENVYGIIAEAEGHVHGKPVDQVHFHEVGSLDAVADVTAVSLLMEEIGADRVLVSPVNTGRGQVKCAHGILPVPAPATAHILQGMPSYANQITGELLTPTGAALLKYFADGFGNRPVMKITAAGYGMGTKDFPHANCVRAFLGEEEDVTDEVIELVCNVDDMTGEEIGYAIERLLSEGALDAFAAPVIMKKSRPGHVVTVLCSETKREEMIEAVFRNTTTIGIREARRPRYVLDRHTEEMETTLGTVRYKVSAGYGVRRAKPEHDDLSRIACERDMTLLEVKDVLTGEKEKH